LYAIAAAGGNPARLTHTEGDVRSVVWTPDGKMLVYTLSQGNADLWTVDVSGLPKSK
jgi:Tol biopolymer transport system component